MVLLRYMTSLYEVVLSMPILNVCGLAFTGLKSFTTEALATALPAGVFLPMAKTY
jgi:hypothetical protein